VSILRVKGEKVSPSVLHDFRTDSPVIIFIKCSCPISMCFILCLVLTFWSGSFRDKTYRVRFQWSTWRSMKEINCLMLKFLFLHSFFKQFWLVLDDAVGYACWWRCWNFCSVYLNSLPSDFSRPFFSSGCSRGKKLSAHFVVECSLTIFIAAGIWADSLAPFSQSKC